MHIYNTETKTSMTTWEYARWQLRELEWRQAESKRWHAMSKQERLETMRKQVIENSAPHASAPRTNHMRVITAADISSQRSEHPFSFISRIIQRTLQALDEALSHCR